MMPPAAGAGIRLGFALDDAEPMFELMLADNAPLTGLEYPPRT